MDFISPGARQYKANLHCHSNLSDGRLTPEELVRAYREQGYSILAITDHEEETETAPTETETAEVIEGEPPESGETTEQE